MTSWLLLAAAVLGIAAYACLRRWRLAELPGGVVYNDTHDGTEAVLVSHRHRLAGKPDHVLRTRDGLVPVERKTKDWRGARPRDGDRAQLLAYCLLVEESLGERVSHGVLTYPSKEHTVLFGAAERREFAELLEAMRLTSGAREVGRSHAQAAQCRGCGYRRDCREALA